MKERQTTAMDGTDKVVRSAIIQRYVTNEIIKTIPTTVESFTGLGSLKLLFKIGNYRRGVPEGSSLREFSLETQRTEETEEEQPHSEKRDYDKDYRS